MTTFFTIAGINDEEFPADHPRVIKFYDRPSAEIMLSFFNKYGLFESCTIVEHNESILQSRVIT